MATPELKYANKNLQSPCGTPITFTWDVFDANGAPVNVSSGWSQLIYQEVASQPNEVVTGVGGQGFGFLGTWDFSVVGKVSVKYALTELQGYFHSMLTNYYLYLSNDGGTTRAAVASGTITLFR